MHDTARPLLPDFRQSGGFSVFRAKLTSNLQPGGNATCNPVAWDGTNWTPQTSITLKIYDPFNGWALGSGALLWAIWTPEMVSASGDLNRCEVLSPPCEPALGKYNKSDNSNTDPWAKDTSALVAIYAGTLGSESAAGYTVTAWNKFGAIADGSFVWLAHDGDGWYVITPFTNSTQAAIGKTSGAINKGSSGTVKVYTGTAGSETDSGKTISAYNAFANVADAKWVAVIQINGQWYIIAGEC